MMFSPNCDVCEKPDAHLVCSRCKCLHYCDQNCQRSDWKAHKQTCEALTAAGKAEKSHVVLSEEAKKLSSVDSNQESECSICLDIMVDPLVLPCTHKFCFPCLNYHNTSQDLVGTCPLCRSELPENLHQYVLNNSAMFLKRANSAPFGSKERILHASLAQAELQRLPASDIEKNIYLQFYVGDVHLCLGEFETALERYAPLYKIITKRMDLINLYINTSNAYIGLGNYETSITSLQSAFSLSEESDTVTTRQICFNFCRCFYEIGDYTPAIQVGESAIQMNRHYQDAYTYVALSYKALGNIDEAVRTMQKAVVYETPWDPENVARLRVLAVQYAQKRDEAKKAAANSDISTEDVAIAEVPADAVSSTSAASDVDNTTR